MKCSNYLIVFFICTFSNTVAQENSALAKYQNCQQELNKINSKLFDLNVEYEKIKNDLRNGLFCSICKSSKTELDKREGFYAHLGRVKGKPVPATQEEMNQAHKNYLSKFNSLSNSYETKKKSCAENYQRDTNNETEKARDEFNRKKAEQENNRNKQLQLQTERYAKEEEVRQKEEIEKQKRIEEIKVEEAKQKEEYNQKAIAGLKSADEANRAQLKRTEENKINDIKNIVLPNQPIEFKPKENEYKNYENANEINQAKLNAGSIDDFDASSIKNNEKNSILVEQVIETVNDYAEQKVYESSINKIIPDEISNSISIYNALKSATKGELNSDAMGLFFSQTENSDIKNIQMFTGSLILKSAEGTSMALDEALNNSDNFDDKKYRDLENQINPLAISIKVDQNAPATIGTYIKGAVAVGAGAVAITLGAPISLIAIAAFSWGWKNL